MGKLKKIVLCVVAAAEGAVRLQVRPLFLVDFLSTARCREPCRCNVLYRSPSPPPRLSRRPKSRKDFWPSATTQSTRRASRNLTQPSGLDILG